MPPNVKKTPSTPQEQEDMESASQELDVSQKTQRPILLDPFAGSGTTILAATKLGYEAIGIEKNAEYCEIARIRCNMSCGNDITESRVI